MVDFERLDSSASEEEIGKRMAHLIRGFREAAKYQDDPSEKAFCEATIPELEDGELRSPVEEALRLRAGSYFPTGYARRLVELAVKKQAWMKLPSHQGPQSTAFYPDLFNHSNSWTHYVYWGVLDYEELTHDVANRNIQANIAERYKSFKLLSFLLKDRWDRPPVVVDTGDSMGLGPKKWLLHKDYPFKQTRVVVPPHGEHLVGLDYVQDYEASEKVNYLRDREPVVDQVVGYDIQPINATDEDSVGWVFANSFPDAKTLRDRQSINEFRSLVQASSPDVHLVTHPIDARDPESLTQLKDLLPDGKADIFTFSAVIYEMSPDEISTVFRNLKQYCKPNALYFINDFAQVKRREPNGLKFIRRNWWLRPYSFGTFTIDPFNPDHPPIEVWRFLTGRCDEMWLKPAGKRLLENVAL